MQGGYFELTNYAQQRFKVSRLARVLECVQVHTMSTTLSIRLDSAVKAKLEALAKSSRRSKSFLAAEAIASYVEAEAWQLAEIHAGIKELDAGNGVEHVKVSQWLRSWGNKTERKPPR